jgi:hypothetical protein
VVLDVSLFLAEVLLHVTHSVSVTVFNFTQFVEVFLAESADLVAMSVLQVTDNIVMSGVQSGKCVTVNIFELINLNTVVFFGFLEFKTGLGLQTSDFLRM